MPNTLVHAAVQTAVSRTAASDRYVPWILVGCVIPDVPWTIQRALLTTPWADPYQLRAYAIIQSSLAVSLILAFAVAAITDRAVNVLCAMSANVLLHLVLDALQTKWANGVLFMAPFSWHLVNIGWVWPEHWLIRVATATGIAVLAWLLLSQPRRPCVMLALSTVRIGVASLALVAYFASPIAFMDAPYRANSHYLSTLSNFSARTGQPIRLDRARYVADAKGGTIWTFAGEPLAVSGLGSVPSGTVSVDGFFTDPETIAVKRYHVHSSGFRDTASYTGLVLIALVVVRRIGSSSWGKRIRDV